MNWRWVLTRKADKLLGKAEAPVRRAIIGALDDLVAALSDGRLPPQVKRLQGVGPPHEWRLRVGDHRVRFTKHWESPGPDGGPGGVVLVVTLGHRREVYSD